MSRRHPDVRSVTDDHNGRYQRSTPEVTVFPGAYHFDGDPTELLAAHDRLVAQFPPGTFDLHVCVAVDGGIVVFDACPSREVFAGFSQSSEFLAAVGAAGLPTPRVEPLGDVHSAELRAAVTP
jgi:hypothetical protein